MNGTRPVAVPSYLWYVGLCVALGPCALAAQDGREARAVRIEDTPAIDGRLDDVAWASVAPITAFLQRNPVEGAAPTESTEVRIAYDDHALFVAFRGFDRAPQRIDSRLVRRDAFVSADAFTIYLDSYADGRTAFEFTVNPSGARRDVFIYGDGTGRDDSWDPVYDWATQIDSLGWTVELRVPFSQLRFAAADSMAFGMRLRRSINRRNEELNWPFVPRDQAGEVSNYGRLAGLVGVPPPRRLEVLPYVAGSSTFEPGEEGNPFATGRKSDLRGGGDIKLGITSGVTLDATVNPDFGQVEADPAVVNLSAFESFFPERRPFFVEGTNLFQFTLDAPEAQFGFGGGRGGQEGLVYTRRIGRAPQVYPDVEGGYSESVLQTTILGAGKLSGQIGKGWAVGLLQAVTAKESAATVDSAGARARAAVEPLTSYTVARAQRTAAGGRVAYGAIGTLTARSLDEPVFAELHRRAWSGGADFSARFGGGEYEMAAGALASRVEGSTEAILQTQERSARYFQRPDQDHMTVDSSRTALGGVGGYARLAKVVGFFTFDGKYEGRSPGFEANDLGFMRSADTHAQDLEVELRWLEPGPVFREFRWQLQERSSFTWGGERTRTTVESQVSGDLLNYWNFSLSGERGFSALGTRLLRGGPGVIEPGNWQAQASARTDFRRPVSVRVNGGLTIEDETKAKRGDVGASLRWRPPGSFSMSLEGRMSWDQDNRQYLTQEVVSDSTYYLLANLDRRELSLTLRTEVALSPRMSIELYAQPFLSAGKYDAFKFAAEPKAAVYDDRFDILGADRLDRPGDGEDITVDVEGDGLPDFTVEEPDFRIVSLRTNVVLRWEFRPGSTFFFVWQMNRRGEEDTGDLNASGALYDALEAPGVNVLAVKLAYWFGL